MTDIETLEDILHREKMSEPLPEYDGQSQKESNDIYSEIMESIPFGDFKGNITEYGERKIRPMLELERIEHQLALLDNYENTLIWVAMYPFALLILLFVILNL